MEQNCEAEFLHTEVRHHIDELLQIIMDIRLLDGGLLLAK